MAERLEAAAPAAADEYTQDGTVDLHGNPVLRSKRGGWKACGFVVGTQAASDPYISRIHPYTPAMVCVFSSSSKLS
jgi:hypothetical protein